MTLDLDLIAFSGDPLGLEKNIFPLYMLYILHTGN